MRVEDIIAWSCLILAVIGVVIFCIKAMNKLFDKIEKKGGKK